MPLLMKNSFKELIIVFIILLFLIPSVIGAPLGYYFIGARGLLLGPIGLFVIISLILVIYKQIKEDMYAASQPYIEGKNPDKLFEPIQPYMKKEDRKESFSYGQLSQDL